MPLFMFLSGYVFYWNCKKNDVKTIVVRRFRGIAIPLISWGTVLFIFELRHGIPQDIILFIISWMNNIVSIWFLWAILLISCIVVIVYKYNGNLLKKIILSIVMFGILIVLPGRINNLFMLPYFVIGFLWCKHEIFNSCTFNKIKWLFCLAWIFLLLFYSKKHYIYTTGLFPNESINLSSIIEQLEIDLFRYIIGFVGTIAVIDLSRFFYNKIIIKSIKDIIIRGGKISLDIYVMQNILFPIIISKLCVLSVRSAGKNYFTYNWFCFDFIITFLCATISFLVLIRFSDLVNKSSVISFFFFGRIREKKVSV